MTTLRLFTLTLLLTVAAWLVKYYLQRPATYAPKLVQVADHVFITSQLSSKSLPFLHRRRIASLVDIRPDGEATDQIPSAEIDSLSHLYGIDFHYIPVPHESIPDSAVDALSDVLSRQTAPTVLYCHSGRRAVRTFALAEASRPDGPPAHTILDMVSKAGFSADDLRDNIDQRIAHRSPASTPPPDEHPHASP